ncbi:acyl-CoA dehydrogenase domain protein [Ferroglobus placidus DSM 10642]|uniref:Acyl-CoA dehydrogenase domain protein n=1 Tax=Ferroglobus placidus (strain DSM 10642 / AEDII12DO) TaxID=589924 RepID=D3S1I5_FERPA|nr:acyl-CoA dehydrogenase family protein [Ferroglobus placidus]ADC66449.1 acyl-CoA dehydrogenase domain protein [Ferroglobus placidus DSM 10642]
MDFTFTEEQEIFRRTLQEFVEKKVKPKANEIERSGEFPKDLFKELADLGCFGLRYPEEYGGANADCVTFCIFCEEMAKGLLSLAASATIQAFQSTHFIAKFGSEELKEEYLVPAIKGEKIGAICMTEPNAGSDLGSITTTAVKDGDEYVINGVKTWVTNGSIADFYTVAARTSKGKGMEGIDFFLVPRKAEGVEVGREIDKMGLRGLKTSEVVFNDVRIPADHLLGEKEGMGHIYLREILAEIRVSTGALSLGAGSAVIKDAIEYAKERVQFGKPIGKFQAVRLMIAEAATELEAAKWLVYHAAWLIDKGRKPIKEASMAKLFASEAAVKAVDIASRVFASYGFSKDHAVERFYRDVRFLIIGGGTSEILKLIIASELGL